MILCAACAAVPEDSGSATESAVDTETTVTVTETETETEPETEPEEAAVLPDYYIDFSDEKNAYACSNLYNVTTEYIGEGIKVNFLYSGDDPDPTYCFDPYMTLPLPEGKFSIDDYPYFVMFLYTSRDDMQGDIRYKTESIHNPASYPTYRFSYGGTGKRKIVLDLQESAVLFIAADDKPVEGNYTDLRMDMFENNANTTDTFIIYSYAFFKTEEEANAFEGIKSSKSESEKLPDLSASYKGDEFVKPDNAYKPKKLLYCFDNAYEFTAAKLKDNGYGGVVTNVRFAQDYLQNDKEFEILKNAFDKSHDIGLHLWIYDEYQWPSGKAFGQVLKDHDEYEATGIELIKLEGNGDINYTLPDNYIKIMGADLVSNGGKTPLETDDNQQYVEVIRRFCEQHPDETVSVYICTNDPKLDRDYYLKNLTRCHVIFPAGNPAEDLCLLSHCNYLIGAPSTFTLVAAMYHDAPLYWIEDPQAPIVFSNFDTLFRHIY